MFDLFESPQLIISRPLLVLFNQFQDLKRSLLHFLFCVPTSLLALVLLLLLAYNGVTVFYVHVPNFLAKFPPEPSNFSRQIPLPMFSSSLSSSSSSKLSSSIMYVVREENSPFFLNPTLQKRDIPLKPASKLASAFRRPKRFGKRAKRRRRSLAYETQNQFFQGRMREFFFGSSGICKLRFFMTWISSLNSFREREVFAIESLFKSHPNACLAIVSKTMDSEEGFTILKRFLNSGFRVMAVSPDYNSVFKNTPAESWLNDMRKGNVNPGKISLGQNLSNLLRLGLLYKFGGIYTDTDIIFVNSFSKLRNVIGAQTVDLETGNWSRLNNAVLVFDKHHPLLFKFIQEFSLTFDGNKWGHNGPYLVSRVVSRLSGEHENTPGLNFTILPPHAFYPVDWSRIRSLFSSPRDELHSKWMLGKMKHIRSKSYAVHLWNRKSNKLKIQKGSIIDHIQNDFCVFCNSSSVSS